MAITFYSTYFDLNGSNVNDSIIPAGSIMFFQQTAAPTGWTKSTAHNDKTLRVTSGTVSSGGSTAFSSIFTSSRAIGGSIGSTTLAESQIPSHNHNTVHMQDTNSFGYGGGAGPKWINTTWGWNTWSLTSGGNVSAGGHNHSFSGSGMDFNITYVDTIIGSKD